ncbi:MAG: ATP synthase F1 subunit delta [Bacteroidota bacterium]
MSSTRIAARYAKPILELAVEKSILEEVKEDMENLSNLYKNNRDLYLMLHSPIIPNLKKVEVIKAIFKGKVNDLTLQSFETILRKNRGNILGAISNEFLHQYNEMKGLQEVSVTSGVQLSKSQLENFEKVARRISGKEPVMTAHVDPDIIGGFILKVGDKQIDQSLSSKLKDVKLKLQMK